MTVNYTQPLPTVEQLEEEISSGKLSTIQKSVRYAEIRALTRIGETLAPFSRLSGYGVRAPRSDGPMRTSDGRPCSVEDLLIDVRPIDKTSHHLFKEQGSRLYLLVADSDDYRMCTYCEANGLLTNLQRLEVPIVACFSMTEFLHEKKGEPFPVIIVERHKRTHEQLRNTSFDQYLKKMLYDDPRLPRLKQ